MCAARCWVTFGNTVYNVNDKYSGIKIAVNVCYCWIGRMQKYNEHLYIWFILYIWDDDGESVGIVLNRDMVRRSTADVLCVVDSVVASSSPSSFVDCGIISWHLCR